MMPLNALTGRVHVFGSFALGCECGSHCDDNDHNRWAKNILSEEMAEHISLLRTKGLRDSADKLQAERETEKLLLRVK